MVGLAPVGARLLLRTDPSQDLRDRYDRLLAYVGRRGRDLGRIQVARRWAEVYVYRARRFRSTTAYRRAARQALFDAEVDQRPDGCRDALLGALLRLEPGRYPSQELARDLAVGVEKAALGVCVELVVGPP